MRGFDPAFYFSEPAALAFDKVAQEHGQLNAFANAVNIFSSHDLPSWEFWEDLELGFSAKSLNLLVGAAGFEHASISAVITNRYPISADPCRSPSRVVRDDRFHAEFF